MSRCPWCQDPTDNSDDPNRLCRRHLAEYHSLSEAELDRAEAEQHAEYADTLGGPR